MDNGLTVKDAGRDLRSGKISSRELTKQYLVKIKESDLNAYVGLNEKGALWEAEVADKVIKRGDIHPLTGIPMAIKDVISTKGLRTTASSKILDNYIPPFDATVIKKLKGQNAVILGKTNLDEFAMGSSTENSAYSPTLNPVDKTRVPGGSSGGSAAAVAGDLCVTALGSDTGGSIRQPASLCGIYGFKPTYGRVSRYGLLAMASSLDQIGPLTKSAADAKTLYQAISGYDAMDSTSLKVSPQKARSIKGLRVGLPKEFFESDGLDDKVRRSVENGIDALKKLGCTVREVSLPTSSFALAVYYIIMPVEVASNLSRYDGIKYGESVIGHAKTLLDVYLETRSRYFGEEAKRRIVLGTYVSSAGYFDAYYGKAQKARDAIRADFQRTFSDVDVIAGPTSPTPAFKFGEKSDNPLQMYLSDIYTVPVNLAGIPSISVPVESVDGLPVGMQLSSRFDDDETLLNLAIAYENIIGGKNG